MFTACKNNPKKEKDIFSDSGMKKLADQSPGLNAGKGTYTISAPEGWTKTDSSMSGAIFTSILSPLEDDADNFRENVNVTTEAAKDYDAKSYSAANLSAMKTQLDEFKLISESETTVGEYPAVAYVYSFKYENYVLKNTAYFVVKNDVGYVITCSSIFNKFDKFQPEFKTCVNSFSVNP
jgi:hypothetical protein